VQGLADDVVILISGKFLCTICDLMQFGGFFRPNTLLHGTDAEQSGKISESHSR
jgi:hypothetical protein